MGSGSVEAKKKNQTTMGRFANGSIRAAVTRFFMRILLNKKRADLALGAPCPRMLSEQHH